MRSDDQLLEAWRAGDPRAGRQLFERHYVALDRFFHNKVGQDTVDLVQETFLACLEHVEAERYENREAFRSWLFSIAYRQLCTHWRNAARDRLRFDAEVVSVHDLDPTPSVVLARSEEQRLLLAALCRCPLNMQVVLELHYWEQMSDAMIARALALPLGTVKSRIRRARQLLAETIEALSSTSSPLETTLANLEDWARQLREHALADRSA